MKQLFPLAPRYRLDDESPWLEGIDPARYYWIAVNGDRTLKVAIPGLNVCSLDEWKQTIRLFKAMQPEEQMRIERTTCFCTIHCISENCFAVASVVNGAPVWHLFDQETLESLLRTSHPDWVCAPKDLELWREMLALSWQQSAVA
ncbi:hypothetical protein [Funiculus sociatus]|uniref:hypothetical protein n=1 Tax=Funiculus sociatus TaxID=450527 RepID=UPI0032988A2D